MQYTERSCPGPGDTQREGRAQQPRGCRSHHEVVCVCVCVCVCLCVCVSVCVCLCVCVKREELTFPFVSRESCQGPRHHPGPLTGLTRALSACFPGGDGWEKAALDVGLRDEAWLHLCQPGLLHLSSPQLLPHFTDEETEGVRSDGCLLSGWWINHPTGGLVGR